MKSNSRIGKRKLKIQNFIKSIAVGSAILFGGHASSATVGSAVLLIVGGHALSAADPGSLTELLSGAKKQKAKTRV